MPETTMGEIAELLKDLIIIQLSAEGVSQSDIARVVGVSLSRVNPIAKVIKKARKYRLSAKEN